MGAADVANAIKTRKLELPKTLPPPELAATLQHLADKGARDFYEGDIAKKLVEGAKAAGGVIGYRDLADYKPMWRAPLKLLFGDYEIFTVPPPSGGGLVIGETLNILADDDLRASGYQTIATLHLLLEAREGFRLHNEAGFNDENRDGCSILQTLGPEQSSVI